MNQVLRIVFKRSGGKGELHSNYNLISIAYGGQFVSAVLNYTCIRIYLLEVFYRKPKAMNFSNSETKLIKLSNLIFSTPYSHKTC